MKKPTKFQRAWLWLHHTADPDTPALPRDLDEVTDEEIEALAASVGATGARRPASE